MITIGADPEVALISLTERRYISAHGTISGTKLQPETVVDGQVLVDGTMLEYGIDPCSTPEEFVKRNESVMKTLTEQIGPDRKIDITPVVIFDKFYVDTLSQEEKDLGCAPDFDAWNGGKMNPRPILTGTLNHTRVCGGHIHIGWTKDADTSDASHLWDCKAVVRALDTYVYPYLHLLEEDLTRKNLYGKLGAFRPKPYGVEWRVPSNMWLKYPKMWPWLFKAIKSVVEACFENKLTLYDDIEVVDRNLKSITATNRASIHEVVRGLKLNPYICLAFNRKLGPVNPDPV